MLSVYLQQQGKMCNIVWYLPDPIKWWAVWIPFLHRVIITRSIQTLRRIYFYSQLRYVGSSLLMLFTTWLRVEFSDLLIIIPINMLNLHLYLTLNWLLMAWCFSGLWSGNCLVAGVNNCKKWHLLRVIPCWYSTGLITKRLLNMLLFIQSIHNTWNRLLLFDKEKMLKYLVQITISLQHAKKAVSDSPGLVDFAIGLVIFVLNLPGRQVLLLGKSTLQKDL